jgi:hypothetical protein
VRVRSGIYVLGVGRHAGLRRPTVCQENGFGITYFIGE